MSGEAHLHFVSIYAGQSSVENDLAALPLAGFSGHGKFTATYIVADGQSNSEGDQAMVNGHVFAGPGGPIRPVDAFPGGDPRSGSSTAGSLWDTLTIGSKSV